MEIILPTNYVFPSRELSLLLAEGEKDLASCIQGLRHFLTI